MSNTCKRVLLLCAFGSILGCGNADPQVDFLNYINFEKKAPDVPSTSNLTPTQELTGTGIKLKGRVSYIGLQNTISSGDVQIKGKISY